MVQRPYALSVPDIGAAQQLRSAQTEVAFSRYTEALIAARQRQPQEDVLSALIHAQVEGEQPLNVVELHGSCNSSSLPATKRRPTCSATPAMRCCASPPGGSALHNDLTLSARVVEEGLRYDAPVQGMFRMTTEDVEMHGVTLPAGARVFVAFGAANRDERIFTHPHRFDLWRPNADQHLAFGHGMHHCLGAAVRTPGGAPRPEILVQRLPDIHLVPAQTITYLPSLLNRALQHLQVRLGTSNHTHG